jgi:[ribosomal protein S18]-alanine N-acetyltransferase
MSALPASLTRATRDDAAVLATIHAAAFPPGESWSRDVFRLQLDLPNVIGLTDSKDALILVRVAGEEAEILTLAVRPHARRHRRGTEMLEAAIVCVAATGASVIFLEVSIKNTAARALYEQFRFTRAGLRRRYYSDGTDALVMRLDLPHH